MEPRTIKIKIDKKIDERKLVESSLCAVASGLNINSAVFYLSLFGLERGMTYDKFAYYLDLLWEVYDTTK